MPNLLLGFKVAILLTSGFQEVEMIKPRQMLQAAGATVHIIAPDPGAVKAWDCDIPQVTEEFAVDVPLEHAYAHDYDALLIPGGYGSPEELRLNENAIAFVRGFAQKPIAAICHGPSLLIDAQLVHNKQLTSYPAIKKDLLNAGAQWIDAPLVTDGNLVTGRGPDDIEAFNNAILKLLCEYNQKIVKNTMNTLKQIKADEIEAVHALLVTCGKEMHRTLNLNHWYPFASLETFQERVKNVTVYGVYVGQQLIASFNVSQTPRTYYKNTLWQDSDAPALYLGNLAVHPEYQGKNIGKWCLQQAEEIARECGCHAIRFDCVERHPWLCRFYEKAGYTKKGIIALPEPTGNVVCFEKIVLYSVKEKL